MRNLILSLFLMLFLVSTASAITLSSNDVYLSANKTYPILLIPNDNNVWDMKLWISEGGNWTSFDFAWTGSYYNMSLIFTELGDYPFVVNSTNVTGSITGNFLVRTEYNVTFRFYKDKEATIFSSNKYINEMAYVTAELVGTNKFAINNYDPYLETFLPQNKNPIYQKPVWYARYSNGVATLRLYEQGEYAIRIIDGEISFEGEYSIPNITDSYGTNIYVGKYILTNSTSHTALLTEKDLNPWKFLFNWLFIIGIGLVVIISIFLFFVIPEKPFLSFTFGVGFISMLILLRIGLWFWIG
jgi:hypothetical protein